MRFKLLRVKLYNNNNNNLCLHDYDLKGIGIHFELAGGWSYGGFEFSRVRVTEGKITVNVQSKSRGNQCWFELAPCLSYRETIVCVTRRQSAQVKYR